MDFQAAQEYLLGFTDYEKLPSVAYSPANYDLRRMQQLLERLGNPHLPPRTVHITGTKGKGSTAAMIASVLTASGYRTGLFTSPHLHTLRERIQVDGQLISEAELAAGVERLKPLVDAIMVSPQYGALTTFELLTALAFSYFAQKAVDYQVVEVGLGGRLDATNMVQPQVAVITSISLDHQEVLGQSLGQIAAEKTGIIKPNISVVASPQEREADMVIERACREKGASLIRVGRDVTWRQISFTWQGQSLAIASRKDSYELFLPLLGDHQMENAAAAVAALEVLVGHGARIPRHSLAQGLARVSWPGRLQVLSRQPWLVVDGAHNPYSIQKLREAIVQYFHYERLFVIMGASVDKDISGMVKELLPLSPRAIVAASQHPRAASPGRVAAEFARWGRGGELAPSVAAAMKRAQRLATAADLILVTGSLFVVAEAMQAMESAKEGGVSHAARGR